MENLLPVQLILIVNLPSQLVWESLVRRMIAKEKLLLADQKKVEHFTAARNIPIANSHLGINLKLKLAQNVNIPLWLKSGKRTKTPQSFVQNVDSKRPMWRPENFK